MENDDRAKQLLSEAADLMHNSNGREREAHALAHIASVHVALHAAYLSNRGRV